MNHDWWLMIDDQCPQWTMIVNHDEWLMIDAHHEMNNELMINDQPSMMINDWSWLMIRWLMIDEMIDNEQWTMTWWWLMIDEHDCLINDWWLMIDAANDWWLIMNNHNDWWTINELNDELIHD